MAAPRPVRRPRGRGDGRSRRQATKREDEGLAGGEGWFGMEGGDCAGARLGN